MAKIKSKGTVIRREIATVMTAIAQVVGITLPEANVMSYDATTLDSGVGKEFEPTGYADGGEASFDLFFDPVLAGHQDLTDQVLAPANCDWEIEFADAGTTTWPFSGHVNKFGGTVQQNDGVKANVGVKLTGLVAYPT